MKTAIIEKYSTLGGTCLNVGCIPSKALLDSSHHYDDAVKHFEEHGIEIPGDIKVNLEKMIARKQTVVDQTTGGIDFLMKKNNIDVYQGLGSLSVGRKPYTDGLNAEAAGVKLNDRGQVEVNGHLQTSASNIYAIGDVIKGAMLAHKAEEEGVFVAETLAGQKPHIDYNLIPGVVYHMAKLPCWKKKRIRKLVASSSQFPMRGFR
ncbi:UNVERIFIED_CONTAM: hypothetical protein GTU68_058994 [Idotea baltica]|nr:hypothetical protein [Idotea baltica]